MPNKYLKRIHLFFEAINRKIKDLHDFHIVLIVIALGLLIRFIHWVYFGSKVISFPVGVDNTLYASALRDHFVEYIYYFHTKPIGKPIIDYLSFSIFGSIQKGHFLLVSLLDSLAPAFILAVLLKLKLSRLFSLVLVSTWSLGLISWEHWRWWGHFDHFNVFLFSLYGWALYNSYNSSSMRRNLILGISFGLLILFNSFAPFVVFLTLLFFGPRLLFREKRLLMARTLIPLMAFLIAGGKNYIQFGVPTTSSIGGLNMMQFVAIAKGHGWGGNFKKNTNFEEFIIQNDYPEWWLWCFNSGMEKGIQTDLERWINSIYGRCCGNIKIGYNFDLLEKKLKQLNENKLLLVLQKDKNTVKKKPWLLHGGIGEVNTRISIEYGKISSRVWKDFIIKEPVEFGKQFYKAFNYYIRGVTFLGNNKYEPQHQIRSDVVRIAGNVITPFFLVGIMIAFYSVVISAFSYVIRILNLVTPSKKYNISNYYQKLFLFLWISISSINLTYLLDHSSENPWVLYYSFKYTVFLLIYLFSVILTILYFMNFKVLNIKPKFFCYTGVTLLIGILLGYLALMYSGILLLSFPTFLIIQISLIIVLISLSSESRVNHLKRVLRQTYLLITNHRILIIFSIILVAYSLILNFITCCENERMFVSISPIALIIGGYYSYFIIYSFRISNK